MDRDVVIATLRAHEAEIRALGVDALYLYGSVARGEAGPQSDVDLFCEYSRSDFSIVSLARAQRILSGYLHRPVDLLTRPSLHPILRENILGEAVRVL